MDSFVNYVTTVDMGETRILIAYARYDGEELRDTVEAVDNSRRIAHEAAISSVNIINQIATMNGVGNIFLGNPESRECVADFCLDVTVQLFQNRKV